MSQELFYELFTGLPRQGPGDAVSTLRALALVPGVGPETRVLDIGCGTGFQTMVLAKGSGARVVAVDARKAFVDTLNAHAESACLGDRLIARVGDMRELDFPGGSFDMVWSEGSLFVMGFEEGLRAWRKLLAPGGHMAVTDACWMKSNPPAECKAFWDEVYPAICTVEARLCQIKACGYDIVGYFPLPASSWWDDYYAPLQENVRDFRQRHKGEQEAQELVARIQREIDIWHAYAPYYSYEFFVMRKR